MSVEGYFKEYAPGDPIASKFKEWKVRYSGEHNNAIIARRMILEGSQQLIRISRAVYSPLPWPQTPEQILEADRSIREIGAVEIGGVVLGQSLLELPKIISKRIFDPDEFIFEINSTLDRQDKTHLNHIPYAGEESDILIVSRAQQDKMISASAKDITQGIFFMEGNGDLLPEAMLRILTENGLMDPVRLVLDSYMNQSRFVNEKFPRPRGDSHQS